MSRSCEDTALQSLSVNNLTLNHYWLFSSQDTEGWCTSSDCIWWFGAPQWSLGPKNPRGAVETSFGYGLQVQIHKKSIGRIQYETINTPQRCLFEEVDAVANSGRSLNNFSWKVDVKPSRARKPPSSRKPFRVTNAERVCEVQWL